MVAEGMNRPLIVIVGETASGKSALAMEIALQVGGEIICADSRTIYRGMDLGTAKPSQTDRAAIKHHCLDIVPPDQLFTVAQYKSHAQSALEDIQIRGKVPVFVGGTGLYVDSILYDFNFRSPADPKYRDSLNNLSVDILHKLLMDRGIPLPTNQKNPRHLIRALETKGQASFKKPLRPNTIVLGLRTDPDIRKTRIKDRLETMISNGLLHEVEQLVSLYGWEAPGLKTIGYQEWQHYFSGQQSLEYVKGLIVTRTLQYAKRQRTWFRRNNSIQWFNNREEIASSVDVFTPLLNN